MKLFHETENKYYEWISYLLNEKKSYSLEELSKSIETHLTGERDFEVIEALLSKENENSVIFEYKDRKYIPIIKRCVPIRTTTLENETLKTLIQDRYVKHFLSSDTIKKIKKVTEHIEETWSIDDITIKNQFQLDAAYKDRIYKKELSIIGQAICEHKAIQYDNLKPGVYEYFKVKVFPVKIEYSFINNFFRICGYEQNQNRFVKINLSTMTNIKLVNEIGRDFEEEYNEFIRVNSNQIVLDVEPIDHVIERCFRIFSFYNRKAIFDREQNKYRLEINYLKFDEKEVIRDILSLGSSVTVIEPKNIRQEVYTRILSARNIYK